jgi:hypothetical protein
VSSFFDFFVAFVVVFVAWTSLRVRLRRLHPGAEGAALTTVLGRALALRVAVAVALNLAVGFDLEVSIFWGDSAYYDAAAWQRVQYWSGESANSGISGFQDSGYGWLNFTAGLYYVFGRNQILVQLLNTVIGTLAILVIYQLAAGLFGASVARRASQFMAFFPGMVIWSSGMYKDPAILLTIAVSMLAVTRLRERFTTLWIVAYVFAALALLTLRFYVFYFLVIATLGTFIFGQKRGFVAGLLTNGVLVVVFFATFSTVVGTTTAERQLEMMMDLQDLQRRRADLASADSGFGQELDISTPAGAVAAVPVGMAHLLFAPFPWAISGFRQALTLPETLYWYSLMPAFLVGLRIALRNRFGPALPMLVFAATLIGAYSVMQGNVGTAYRQRTQVTMFFFILMAVGLEEKQKRKAAMREAMVTAPRVGRGAEPAQGPRGWAVPGRPAQAPAPAPAAASGPASRPAAHRKVPRGPVPPRTPPRRGA